jgi:hypothetical protein
MQILQESVTERSFIKEVSVLEKNLKNIKEI